ncbi:hypothetical protein F5Y09DRAFT_344226 [Xylaria sp. FL1042]|nr:hypothetical protein F5Y09DRAFT_344226 [Xylaria sp. FL1042]
MGNNNSTPSPSPSPTHLSVTSTHTSSLSTETHRSFSFSVSPFEHSTLVSITKASPTSSSHVYSSIRTTEYCTWNWEQETESCTLRTITATPTPFTLPTPTGRYGTSETSFSFPYYTCTDFLCIDSVASQYGFSLCLATTFTNFGPPVETTDKFPTATLTCDPDLDWEGCPGPTIAPPDSTTDEWTEVWPTLTWHYPTETSSDYDVTRSSTTSSLSAEECEYGIGCFTSLHYTSKESRQTPPAPTITSPTSSSKHSYSYRSTSTSSTKRTTTSTTSDCDPWWDDCTPALPTEPTTWEWDPDPWSGHTVSTTIRHIPRESADTEK